METITRGHVTHNWVKKKKETHIVTFSNQDIELTNGSVTGKKERERFRRDFKDVDESRIIS